MTEPAVEQFPLLEARSLAKGLFEPKPAIYWADFLFSAFLGWTAFILAAGARPLSLWQGLCYVVAALALYRAVIFTHELSHFRANSFGLFRLVWNLFCGLPLMVPSFMYRGVHTEHHRRDSYGTHADGEYLPFATQRPYHILLYLAQIFILPLLAAARFIVLTPLAYLSPAVRRLVWERASSLTIDLDYRRPLSGMQEAGSWRWQELGACAYGATAIALVLLGKLPAAALGLWYAVAVLIFLLNSLRTLAAHAYRNPGDRSLSVAEQFLDSVDVPGNRWTTTLWAPVGLRYHATHHLFPGMPYHNLGKTYRKLVTELGDNRLYLQATRTSLWHALRGLWHEASAASR